METLKLYLFSEYEETKAVIVSTNVDAAIEKLQKWLDEKNEGEEFMQKLTLIPSTTGIGDWDAEIRESYKPTNSEIQVMNEIVGTTYQIFEFPFSVGKVYGAIGNF